MSKVILLTGPAGGGKSTTADKFASESKETWAHIEQDTIRRFIRSGFANPSEEWTDETRKQWVISVDICCYTIRKYHENGINCIVDAFISPTRFQEWKERLKGIGFKLVVLLPELQTTLKQNS